MGDGNYTGKIVKEGTKIATIALMYSEKADISEVEIYEITFAKVGMEYGYFSIDGIGAGDDIKYVREMYGEPTKFRMDTTKPKLMGDTYEYKHEDGKRVLFATNEKGEIINIHVSCREK